MHQKSLDARKHIGEDGIHLNNLMEEFPGGNSPGRNLTELNSLGQGDSKVRISLVSIFETQIAVIMKFEPIVKFQWNFLKNLEI